MADLLRYVMSTTSQNTGISGEYLEDDSFVSPMDDVDSSSNAVTLLSL